MACSAPAYKPAKPSKPGTVAMTRVHEILTTTTAAVANIPATTEGPAAVSPPAPPPSIPPATIHYERIEETTEAQQPETPAGPATAKQGQQEASLPATYQPPAPPQADPRAASFDTLTWAGIGLCVLGVGLFIVRVLPWTAALFAIVPMSAPAALLLLGVGLIAAPTLLLSVPWWAWTAAFAAIVIPGILANWRYWRSSRGTTTRPDRSGAAAGRPGGDVENQTGGPGGDAR